MHSLSRRLLVSVAVPLALFFGVMMLVLDTGFRTLSERQLHALLDAQMVTLIAAAEPNPAGGYDAPLNGLDTRLATPDSGLYAQIRSNKHVWSSPSTAGVHLDFGPALAQGERQFSYALVGHGRVAIESRGISFQDPGTQDQGTQGEAGQGQSGESPGESTTGDSQVTLGQATQGPATQRRATQGQASQSQGSQNQAPQSQATQNQATPSEASQTQPNPDQALTFSVAVSLTPYEEQLWLFRSRMLGWFSGLMLLLLLSLAALLRKVLAPLRRLEREIHEVEEGRTEMLGSGYPRELSGVARHLNALLVGERKRVARYRDTLGNLAHGLKTPLSVMRTALSSDVGSGTATRTIGNEIDRMTDIIEHQLKRAASGGALLGQAPVAVAAVATDLRAALLKVYSRKDLAIELAIQEGSYFIGDRGDFVELFGNLLDNACKWCREKVRVSVAVGEGHTAERESLTLAVEDDGSGIAEEDRAKVLERGVRTDENVPGHGLGLAMVHDTVDLYGGNLMVDASPLGGARFSLRLPGKKIG